MIALTSVRSGLIGACAVLVLSMPQVIAQDGLGDGGIRGAGSTFAYPILSRWSREYRAWLSRGGEFPAANASLNDPPASSALEYESVGSLAGTLRLKDRAVDFAASDMPLKPEELTALGLGQFPLVIGGIVVAVNLDGIAPGALHLTGPLLADIFLGRVTRWSDARLRALNPSVVLPDANIAVVHRSDGSGTTFNFTDYLSKVSPDWKLKAGSGLLVSWPTGVGAKGNEGVAQVVRKSKYSIGYVDYAQAIELKLIYARLQNRAGRFVLPEPASFQSAATSTDWGASGDFNVVLTNAPSRNAYPIAATVFALLHRGAPPAKARAVLDFFRWSLQHGSGTATALGYVPLPQPLVQDVSRYWSTTFKTGS